MVAGIDKLREFFAGHTDKYAIIGGAACELVFGQVGGEFRATKDIDMVLCVEVVDVGFGVQFKAFLEAGGYTARERSNERKEFYRFHRPTDKNFPAMIELFARKPDAIVFPEGTNIVPIPVEDNILSLSAILLNEPYFEALQKGKRAIDGITVLDQRMLIPFKAFAYMNLIQQKANGESVRSGDIHKHRDDVFRLAQLLQPDEVVELSDEIKSDLKEFVAAVEADEVFDTQALGIARDQAFSLLRKVYNLA